MSSHYQQMIREQLVKLKNSTDPMHVEATMRMEHRTLDHLSRREFSALVARSVVDIGHPDHECDDKIAAEEAAAGENT